MKRFPLYLTTAVVSLLFICTFTACGNDDDTDDNAVPGYQLPDEPQGEDADLLFLQRAMTYGAPNHSFYGWDWDNPKWVEKGWTGLAEYHAQYMENLRGRVFTGIVKAVATINIDREECKNECLIEAFDGKKCFYIDELIENQNGEQEVRCHVFGVVPKEANEDNFSVGKTVHYEITEIGIYGIDLCMYPCDLYAQIVLR